MAGAKPRALGERGVRQDLPAAESELDPVKRAAMFIRMNELVIENNVVVPIVARPRVAAVSRSLRAPMSGWDNDTWLLKDWYRE